MSNLITCRALGEAEAVKLSNGLMAVVTDVLVLAATDLAKSEWERKVCYWLVQHDQSRVGLGAASFDLGELGWSHAEFEAKKRFLLAVVDAALEPELWQRLPFSPQRAWLTEALGRIRSLLERFPREAILEPGEESWVPDELPSRGRCEEHGVDLHEQGCILCNDA